jgi:hypothetical protein
MAMNVTLRGCEQPPGERLVPEHLPFTISRNGTVDMQRWQNELARGNAQVAQLEAKAAGVAADASDSQLRRAQFHGRQLQGRTVSLAPGIGTYEHLGTPGHIATTRAPLSFSRHARASRRKSAPRVLGSAGYVVREVGETQAGSARVKDFQATQRFDEVTYWNHDTEPSGTDWFPKVMRWQKDAPVLHGQVTDGEFAAAEAAMVQRRMAADRATT